MWNVQLPAEVESYIIGMWRFHEAGRPRLWCITYRWRGCYYDVQGEKTLGRALERVRRALVLLKATEAAKRLKKKALPAPGGYQRKGGEPEGRCPHCSFQPTSNSDFCSVHRRRTT